MISLGRLAAFVVCALLSACASNEIPGAISAPEIYRSDLAVEPSVYSILPGDEIEVRFFYTPELDTTLLVRADGLISLPLVQGIQAAGLTPERLAANLKQSYQSELKDPEIAVILLSSAGHSVYVGGQVAEPGVIVPTTGQIRVFDAVLQAGGLLPSAHGEQVLVIRQRAHWASVRLEGLEGGYFKATEETDFGPQVILVDLRAYLEEGDTRQNIILAPKDVIFVPQSRIANINQWVDQYIRGNLPFGVTAGYRLD